MTLRVLNGKSIETVAAAERLDFGRYSAAWCDLGTGDGRYIYRLARENPDVLCVGIDAVAENMMAYASRAKRREQKGGAPNLIYAVAAAEGLPQALFARFDRVSVNLPWGSLLEGVVKGDEPMLRDIARLLKPGGAFDVVFSYGVLHEAAQMDKRGLPPLSPGYIQEQLAPRYAAQGLEMRDMEQLEERALKGFGTQWASRLAHSRSRDVYRLAFVKSTT